MRLETEMPMTPLEQEIENILIDNRYLPEDIRFVDSAWDGTDGSRYLQVGYWSRLSDDVLADLGERLIDELEMDMLFYYVINSEMNDHAMMQDVQTLQTTPLPTDNTIVFNGVQTEQMPNNGMSNV